MPILLTTPWQMPESDPPENYPRAQITLIGIYPEQKMVQIKVEYGDVVGGVWVHNVPDVHLNVEIVDGAETEFSNIMAELTLEDESIYTAIKRLAYDYVQTNYPHLAGTIE